MKIAIDIGHANGTGSRGNGMEEHAVATKIGTNLAVMLEEQGHEVDVIDFPNLSNTADINKTVAAVNAGNYDISVSIHCDSSDSPNSCGAHVCYNRTYTKTGDIIDSVKGKALARCIAARIPRYFQVEPILPKRGQTRAKSFRVLLFFGIQGRPLCSSSAGLSPTSMMRR